MSTSSTNTNDPTEPLRVLLVDDDLDVLAANARFLRIAGLNISVANAASAALERLADEPVNACVTDLRMPGMNGIEFARAARQISPLLPIVFFSAYATVPDVVAAMRLGAVDFLEKPVDPERLLHQLSEIEACNREGVALPREAFDLSDSSVPFRHRVLAYEKYLIETSLRQHQGNINSVLAALKISRRTLNEKMSRLGIKRKHWL